MRKGHWCTCQWLDIMSRMSREIHVRFWERLGVNSPGRLDKSPRAEPWKL